LNSADYRNNVDAEAISRRSGVAGKLELSDGSETCLKPLAAATEKADAFLMTDSLVVGGIERQFGTLARALDPNHFKISLGCLQLRGPFLDGIGEITEFNLGGSFLSRQAHRARRRLAHYLRSRGTAIAQSCDFYSNLTLIPTARWAGVPVVLGSLVDLGDFLTPLQFATQLAAFWLCDRVICNSRAAADRLIDAGLPESKISLIRNGLPREAFAETIPEMPRDPRMLRVGFIARMNHAVKNHAGFLRAASRLACKFSAVEFVLVGDGPLRSNLEHLAKRLGIADRTRFMGERLDVATVLATLDVSVMFSYSESLPNVVLESMAAGVPVIASRVGGIPEIVCDGTTGLLVAPGDEDGIASAMERLLTSPSLWRECSHRALELVNARFRIEDLAREYELLYADLLARKNWRPRRRVSSFRATMASEEARDYACRMKTE
jgi:glycosyltransferase involved in cell wall biosynthesis